MSSIPQNKKALVEAVSKASNKLLNDYQNIPIALTRLAEIEGNIKNTRISVCDTLAYLIGWGKLVLHWHAAKSQGLRAEFPATGYKWNQLGLLAQSFYQAYRDWDYAALQSEFKTTIQDILAVIEASTDQQLYGQPWYNQWTLGRMIQLNTSSPMKNVRTKVRRFKKSRGIDQYAARH